MNQKQQSIITLKALFAQKKAFETKYIQEKLSACLDLQNTEVLLDEEAKKRFDKIVENLRLAGRIIARAK
ncbi:hypothetical protein KAW50_03540 [candidate division WOR-3 bacterium]|nr:hypothetical protein [candidate division WOR-3 bacterium]